MTYLTPELEEAFVNYIKTEHNITDDAMIKNAVGFARVWVTEGGLTDAKNLWRCFVQFSPYAPIPPVVLDRTRK